MPLQIQKVFLSSTAYDLKDVRAEVARFLEEDFGLEVVCFESSDFPVEKGLHSHDVCINAGRGCDLFLLIIDKRYGGEYRGSKYPQYKAYNGIPMSITWAETAFAYDNNIPVHTFVRQQTWDERPIYKKAKKEGRNYTPTHVNDCRVFELIDCLVYQSGDTWIDRFNDVVDLKKTLVGRLEHWKDKPATITKRYLKKIQEERKKERQNENCLDPTGQYIDPPLVLIETERYIPPRERQRAKQQDLEKGYGIEPSAIEERVVRQHIDLSQLIHGNYPRVSIVADSGLGKTTLLKELILMIATNEITTPLIPLYFHFRELCSALSERDLHESRKSKRGKSKRKSKRGKAKGVTP